MENKLEILSDRAERGEFLLLYPYEDVQKPYILQKYLMERNVHVANIEEEGNERDEHRHRSLYGTKMKIGGCKPTKCFTTADRYYRNGFLGHI